MDIKYNVPGKKRKELAQTIGTWSGAEVRYCGAPTFAYEVDYFTIDKDGRVIFDLPTDSKIIESLMEHLESKGFEMNLAEELAEFANEPTVLTIEVPLDKVAVGNLTNLITSKESLIKKALGISDTTIEVTDTSVKFPWFPEVPDSDTSKAYTHFISALCEMSVNQKRINRIEKEVDNEKYAFRCFLLRLGFIGTEYKTERKILLKNLNGSSAFKGGVKNEIS